MFTKRPPKLPLSAMTCFLVTASTALAQTIADPVAIRNSLIDRASSVTAPDHSGAPADFTGAAGGGCPGFGDCCVAHGGPGCLTTSCCEIVTAIEFFCGFAWGADCVSLAREYCGSLCGGPPCPGKGDCCTSHFGTGCQDATCCETVCFLEASCCEAVWDASCAAQAQNRCGSLCTPPDPCPGSGDCCLAHDTVGCAEEACCDLICGDDPYCCENRWDPFCADLADLLCAGQCAGACPAEGDCCSAHSGPGCDEPSCCQAVCAGDPDCCSGPWTVACVALAESLCAEHCSGSCPSIGGCCSAHGTIGCDDRACCQAVCDANFFCCSNRWDADCVLEAQTLCPSLCGSPAACGTGGDCCTAHATPGCEDPACCGRVCSRSAGCCSGTWSESCVTLALDLCGRDCGCDAPGDLDGNGVYNLRDFAAFQRCFTGPDAGPILAECECGDVTGDDDVDLLDLRILLQFLFR